MKTHNKLFHIIVIMKRNNFGKWGRGELFCPDSKKRVFTAYLQDLLPTCFLSRPNHDKNISAGVHSSFMYLEYAFSEAVLGSIGDVIKSKPVYF